MFPSEPLVLSREGSLLLLLNKEQLCSEVCVLINQKYVLARSCSNEMGVGKTFPLPHGLRSIMAAGLNGYIRRDV